MRILLASNSPRRRELLALGGWTFEICAAEIDETPLPGEDPRDYVLRLAAAKARVVAERAQPGSLVIAADTTVVDGGQILGKPADDAEALAMLTRLRGHTHQVYTAIAVLRVDDGALLTEVCATDVPMRDYSNEEIRDYVTSGDPLDKAGAYAIQHAGFHPVEAMQGCFANVMGLPLCHLTRTLRKLGVQPEADVPQACQGALEYECPVFQEILGMREQIEPYKTFVRPYYASRDVAHNFRHIERIISRLDMLSEGISPPPRRDRLYFLACFHGLGARLRDDEKFRGLATDFMINRGFTDEEIRELFQSLARHLESPETVEEEIVHDANKIETLGAFGIAKAFTMGGILGQSYEETADYFEHQSLGKAVFRTPKGKQLAEEGRAFALEFLRRLRQELNR